jgi:hypothetical protein
MIQPIPESRFVVYRDEWGNMRLFRTLQTFDPEDALAELHETDPAPDETTYFHYLVKRGYIEVFKIDHLFAGVDDEGLHLLYIPARGAA